MTLAHAKSLRTPIFVRTSHSPGLFRAKKKYGTFQGQRCLLEYGIAEPCARCVELDEIGSCV